MLHNFLEKVKGFLLNPVETFQKSREDTLSTALAYFFILLFIEAVLSALVLSVGFGGMHYLTAIPFFGKMLPPIAFVLILVIGIIGVFVGSAIVHIGVVILGGKQGYLDSKGFHVRLDPRAPSDGYR